MKGNSTTQYGSVKGEREKGKSEIQTFSPFPLPFSQTTREMKISYPNRIVVPLRGSQKSKS